MYSVSVENYTQSRQFTMKKSRNRRRRRHLDVFYVILSLSNQMFDSSEICPIDRRRVASKFVPDCVLCLRRLLTCCAHHDTIQRENLLLKTRMSLRHTTSQPDNRMVRTHVRCCEEHVVARANSNESGKLSETDLAVRTVGSLNDCRTEERRPSRMSTQNQRWAKGKQVNVSVVFMCLMNKSMRARRRVRECK